MGKQKKYIDPILEDRRRQEINNEKYFHTYLSTIFNLTCEKPDYLLPYGYELTPDFVVLQKRIITYVFEVVTLHIPDNKDEGRKSTARIFRTLQKKRDKYKKLVTKEASKFIICLALDPRITIDDHSFLSVSQDIFRGVDDQQIRTHVSGILLKRENGLGPIFYQNLNAKQRVYVQF